ncbi:MAG: hypothetical protein ACLSBB_07510 [Ruthenibacterium lactatiformans]
MNLEAPDTSVILMERPLAFACRPANRRGVFADIRAAQAVADYFTAVELAPEHLSCVMEDLCYAVRTLPRRSPTRSCPAFMRRTERALFKTNADTAKAVSRVSA